MQDYGAGYDSPFAKEIMTFKGNLDALGHFILLVNSFLKENQNSLLKNRAADLAPLAAVMHLMIPDLPESAKKISENISKQNDITITEIESNDPAETKKKSYTIEIEDDKGAKFEEALLEYTKSLESQQLMDRNSLLALISIAEWFLSRLIHLYYTKYPETLEGKDKVFSLKDLMAFDSVAEAREYLLESKVEDIMRGAFSDWINFFKTTCKLSMSYIDKNIDDMVEACQRRNLIVHNGAVINSIYLSKVAPKLKKELKKGQHISVSKDYLQKNINIFELNCILLSLEFWKKWDASDQERGKVISTLSESIIKEKRWGISEGLNFFLINDKNIPEKYRVPAQLNYWLSIKRQNRWEEIQKDVESADYSAKDPIYKLSYLMLTENKDEVFKLLSGYIASGFVSIGMLKENPIFDEIRADERYLKLVSPEPKSEPLSEKTPVKRVRKKKI